MSALQFDFNFLKKWIILNGLLWPVGLYLNFTLVYILLDGLGRSGLYSFCKSDEIQLITLTPLHTSNLCVQGWFALEFCWAGIIVGKCIGFVQWRFVAQPIKLPKAWIDSNTLSWAVGGPLAYLFYRLFLPSFYFQFAPFLAQDIPDLTLFTWVFILSKLISCVGEQRILNKHWSKPNHWVLSNFLGVGSAGIVDIFLPKWIPAILHIGLFVGVTSGLALLHYGKHSEEQTFMPEAQL